MGRMDDPILTEGDRGFRGIDSYLEPTTLEGGLVETSQNMRLDGDIASVRKGIEFKSGAVSLTYAAGSEEIFCSTLFSDPATGIEFIASATKNKVILWNDQNDSGIDIAYPGGETVTTADNASFVQAMEKLILFRGTSKDPLEWNGDFTTPTSFTVKNNSSPTAGRIECPSTNFGLFFANRLIVPQPSDSAYTVIMSDLLDTDNFFAADSQFRINRGTADRLVGFTPYLENQLLVFYRNSIHLINNVATTSAAAVFEITRQRGCVARKSVAASGPQIYFLSDDGVFTLQQGLDPAKGLGVAISKVSGEAVPLSRPIQDQFKEVNYAHADKAVGIVFDNKYYLAVPTGSSTTNNKVFIYDILNTAWTSVDSFPAGFAIDDFVTVLHGSNPQKRRLFAVSDKGWHLVEEGTTDITGTVGSASTTSTAISAKLKTRSFTLGNLDVKRWRRGQLGVSTDEFNEFFVFPTTDGIQNYSTPYPQIKVINKWHPFLIEGNSYDLLQAQITGGVLTNIKLDNTSAGAQFVGLGAGRGNDWEVLSQSVFTIKVNTIDPDSSSTVLTHTKNGAEDSLLRFGSGRARGYAASVEVDVTVGRPSFRHVSLEAIAGGANARREIA